MDFLRKHYNNFSIIESSHTYIIITIMIGNKIYKIMDINDNSF